MVFFVRRDCVRVRKIAASLHSFRPEKSIVSRDTVRYFITCLRVIRRKLFKLLRRLLISVHSIEALERCRNWESLNYHLSSITHLTSRKFPFSLLSFAFLCFAFIFSIVNASGWYNFFSN